MFDIKKLKYNSVLISTNSTENLSKIFIRFQEYYEGPKFKGKIFTLGQLKEWYSIKYGADTYYKDWSGYNFPSWVLEPFRKGLFDPLTKEEIYLLNLFKFRYDNFYIIGANDKETIRHELSHALYNYNKNYKNSIDDFCEKNKKDLVKLKNYLLKKGYHKDVINDEIQAYITDNDVEFIISNIKKEIIEKINHLYKKYK